MSNDFLTTPKTVLKELLKPRKEKMLHGAIREAQSFSTRVTLRRSSWQQFVHVRLDMFGHGFTDETGREWHPSVEDILARDWIVMADLSEPQKCRREPMFENPVHWGLRERQA